MIGHARAVCAVTSPTVNCYKRLKLGQGLYSTRSGFSWTPAFAGYGDNNRTQMIRVAGPGHCEDRTVSAGCNPYLGLAAILAAGLDGIERRLDPGPPNLGNMYERSLDEIRAAGIQLLPQSLLRSVVELKEDRACPRSLGRACRRFHRSQDEGVGDLRAAGLALGT